MTRGRRQRTSVCPVLCQIGCKRINRHRLNIKHRRLRIETLAFSVVKYSSRLSYNYICRRSWHLWTTAACFVFRRRSVSTWKPKQVVNPSKHNKNKNIAIRIYILLYPSFHNWNGREFVKLELNHQIWGSTLELE